MVLNTDNGVLAYALREIGYKLATDLLRNDAFRNRGDHDHYRRIYDDIRPLITTGVLPVFRNDTTLSHSALSMKNLVVLRKGQGEGMLAVRGPDGKPKMKYAGDYLNLFGKGDTISDVLSRIESDELLPLRNAMSKLLD
jgi:hypothetical protein